jgi:hypothetical protein
MMDHVDIDLNEPADKDSGLTPLDPDRPGLFLRKRDGVIVVVPPENFKEPSAWALLPS